MATETEMLEQVARALGVDEVPDRLKSTLLRKVITAQGGSCDDLPDNLQSTLLERLAATCGGAVNTIEAESPTKAMLGEFAQLGKVCFPNATSIGSGAFNGCIALTGVDLPNCKTVGSSAFIDCSNLREAKMPNVLEIGGGAFQATSIKNVVLPNVTAIGSSAFNSTPNLDVVDIYKNVTTISNGTFNRSAVQTIILRGAGVTPIAAWTFDAMLRDYYIYVPAALKAQYETAAGTSQFANRFRAIEDYPAICG